MMPPIAFYHHVKNYKPSMIGFQNVQKPVQLFFDFVDPN